MNLIKPPVLLCKNFAVCLSAPTGVDYFFQSQKIRAVRPLRSIVIIGIYRARTLKSQGIKADGL